LCVLRLKGDTACNYRLAVFKASGIVQGMPSLMQAAQTPSARNAAPELPAPSAQGAFVVNLSSSTSPAALTPPAVPELKRYSYFVSRRREDRRERFRLHLGYFTTQQQAESMLEFVRQLYPGAWAGLAPGRKAPEHVAVPHAITLSDVPPVGATALVAEEKLEAAQSLQSVRQAIAQLGEESGKQPLSSQQALQLLEAPASSLTDSQKVLSPVALPSPKRTSSTLAAPREAPDSYAVQLRWSAQPIGISELPPLAIFDAYTLYRAKGRNDGRHWHALRLGFFNDLVSANQVANYIRPEFGEASVVPVTRSEREGAQSAAANESPQVGGTPIGKAEAVGKPTPAAISNEFKLIDDGPARPAQVSRLEMMLTGDANVAKQSSDPRAKPSTRRPPANLEETLEILGANDLKLADKSGERLAASDVRKLRHAAEKKGEARSMFGKWISRLTTRSDH
jgi:hypothetical protein